MSIESTTDDQRDSLAVQRLIRRLRRQQGIAAVAGVSCADAYGSEFRVRVTRLSVLPTKEPLFSEQCTNVSIADEAAGEFLEIEQQSGRTDAKSQTIAISPEEWPALKQAIEQLLADCETQNAKGLAQMPAPKCSESSTD